MDHIERERLRVYDDACRTLAERVDPADTLTVEAAIAGRRFALCQLYRELADADGVLAALERRTTPPPKQEGTDEHHQNTKP